MEFWVLHVFYWLITIPWIVAALGWLPLCKNVKHKLIVVMRLWYKISVSSCMYMNKMVASHNECNED